MHRLQFTVILVALSSVAAVAQADRVVLLPPDGDASQEQLVQVEAGLVQAIEAAGHVPVTEQAPEGIDPEEVPPPETANELRAVAELQNARWALVPRVLEQQDGGYRLLLRVGDAEQTRVEELEAEVRQSREAPRLEELVGAMLRPEGLGDDAGRLGGEDEVARAAERQAREQAESPEPSLDGDLAAAEAEAEAREQEAPAEPPEQEAGEEPAAEPPAEEQPEAEDAPPYGTNGSLHLQAGYGLRGIVRHDDRARGGILHSLELKVGKSFDGLPGFELRGGLDFVLGDDGNGFALYGGAVYLASPFSAPIYLGAGVELGMHKATSGNDVAQLMVRGGPVVAWNPVGALYVEAAPEMQYLSANDGAITLGVSLRAGWRF